MESNASANEKETGRKILATDFYVEVEGIGRFRFARRSMRDEFQIGAEYSRLTEGVSTPTPWLEHMATMVSNLKVLAVTVPADWDIDRMDPLDEESYSRIIKVHKVLREQEDSFRGRIGKAGKETGQDPGEDTAVLVPEEISAVSK